MYNTFFVQCNYQRNEYYFYSINKKEVVNILHSVVAVWSVKSLKQKV